MRKITNNYQIYIEKKNYFRNRYFYCNKCQLAVCCNRYQCSKLVENEKRSKVDAESQIFVNITKNAKADINLHWASFFYYIKININIQNMNQILIDLKLQPEVQKLKKKQ